MQCRAKSKRSGERCKRHAGPSGVCRMHGARTPTGEASTTFKHGRYSKYMPVRLLDKYHESLNDEQLLEIRDEIAAIDARIKELWKRLDTGETGKMWEALHHAAAEFELCRSVKDDQGMARSLESLLSTIRMGFGDWAAWRELGEQMDRLTRYKGQEWRRLVEMQQVATVEQVMTLLAAVESVIRKHLHDPQSVRAFADDLRKITTSAPGKPDLTRKVN